MSDANTVQVSCDTCMHDDESSLELSLTCYECAGADGNPNWEPIIDEGDMIKIS